MRRIFLHSLALLCVLLAFSTLHGQMLPRYFPIPPGLNLRYFVHFAPILPTADGGYLINLSYGGPNLHGPTYDGDLIKTDAALVPQWSHHMSTKTGYGCFTYPDSTLIHFGGIGQVSVQKLDLNGLSVWEKYFERPIYHGFEIVDVFERSGRLVATGSLTEVDGFGALLHEAPVQLVMDTAGNVLSVDSMAIPGKNYIHVSAARGDLSGGTWLFGTAGSSLPGSGIYFIARMDSNLTFLFANEVSMPNNAMINQVIELSNGDLMASGIMGNPQTGGPMAILTRFSPNGSLVWGKGIFELTKVSGIHEFPSGDLLVMGAYQDSLGQNSHSAVVRMTGNGNLAWAKYSVPSYGVGSPLILSANDWVFPASGDYPMLLQMDSMFQNTNCNSMPFGVSSYPPFITTNPLTMAAYPITLTMATQQATIVQPQFYVDSCAGVLLSVSEPAPDRLTAFPNPSAGRVQIQANGRILRLQAVDALGREVVTCTPGNAATEVELPRSGVYWLRAEMEDGAFVTRRIVVAR